MFKSFFFKHSYFVNQLTNYKCQSIHTKDETLLHDIVENYFPAFFSFWAIRFQKIGIFQKNYFAGVASNVHISLTIQLIIIVINCITYLWIILLPFLDFQRFVSKKRAFLKEKKMLYRVRFKHSYFPNQSPNSNFNWSIRKTKLFLHNILMNCFTAFFSFPRIRFEKKIGFLKKKCFTGFLKKIALQDLFQTFIFR